MLTVKKNPPDYGHDDLLYNGKVIGFVGRADGAKCLEKCPKCGHENYALSVLSGICAWCGWDVNSVDE